MEDKLTPKSAGDILTQLRNGGAKEMISNAWKPRSATRGNSSTRRVIADQRDADTFLTEAQTNELEFSQLDLENTEPYFEDFLKEIESMSSAMKQGRDDLAELRKRISRCQKSIDTQSANYSNIEKSFKEIQSQSNSMEQKLRTTNAFFTTET